LRSLLQVFLTVSTKTFAADRKEVKSRRYREKKKKEKLSSKKKKKKKPKAQILAYAHTQKKNIYHENKKKLLKGFFICN